MSLPRCAGGSKTGARGAGAPLVDSRRECPGAYHRRCRSRGATRTAGGERRGGGPADAGAGPRDQHDLVAAVYLARPYVACRTRPNGSIAVASIRSSQVDPLLCMADFPGRMNGRWPDFGRLAGTRYPYILTCNMARSRQRAMAEFLIHETPCCRARCFRVSSTWSPADVPSGNSCCGPIRRPTTRSPTA